MIITQTPFRMSFLGGGTDYRPYFEEYGGSVITTTFNKYCYLILRELPPFFHYRSQITYSKIERVNDIRDIEHPAARECLKYLNMKDIHMVYDADLPARSGLGSSSAFTVGLLYGIHALKHEYIDKMELSKEAIFVEQQLLKENVGVQDQIAVAFGGLNKIEFTASGYCVKPIVISSQRKNEFNDHLILFFTGIKRFASEIAGEQIKNTKNKLTELHKMKKLVDEGERILSGNGDIKEFGRLLDHSWQLKRSLTSKISNNTIDNVYHKAKTAGAIGGKLLGAGGGGFMVFFAEPEKHDNIKNALSELLSIPFEFEGFGARILH